MPTTNSRRILIGSVASLFFVGAQAQAQGLSVGCDALNNPALDAQYTAVSQPARQFSANELIQVSANAPDSGTSTAVILRVDGVQVDTAAYPGSTSYLVPADATLVISWLVDFGNATWDVSCALAPATPPTTGPVSVPVMPFGGLVLTGLAIAYLSGRRMRAGRR